MIKTKKGMLVEYALSLPPLALEFDLNPESISRTRTATVDAAAATITDFLKPSEANRIGQAVSPAAETITFEILLDATDKLSDTNHRMHKVALTSGIEPEIATLRSMLEPKVSGAGGFQLMASIGKGKRAHEHDEHLSVLLFVWGTHIMPVFMTSLTIKEQAHLPSLSPYRATANISLQVLESNNPFYNREQVDWMKNSALNLINLSLPF
ncbi:MAG: hypothetical protein JKY19_00810 [Alcanivoracaceae bacterium]|nr:hypothetical protein [Alcanivoracaceae bacterium]